MRNTFFQLLINLFVTFLIFLLFSPSLRLIYYIDIIFYFSLTYLLCWMIFFTIKGRFFDGVIYGFRKVGNGVLRKLAFDDWEDKPMPSAKVGDSFLAFLLKQGLYLLIIMFILLIIYYF
ncbi:DUF3899 domain-containing protein [Paraliobacillus zengyii]|uniref:DUF3899 domain-containing protein n=1 Tax=Paraliobacillus zengyii TaxID=2213194 RepID=UPI0013A6B7B8|nr:DUF3899 domain-containing protein [Paraliobacillus zengyii]